MAKQLGKKLNMSFDEFINRPRHQIELMLKVANQFSKMEEAAANNAMDAVKSANEKVKRMDDN